MGTSKLQISIGLSILVGSNLFTPSGICGAGPAELYVINEGWYGMETGSVNRVDILTGETTSRLFFNDVSPYELGVTTQYATMHNGLLYLVSKDPSSRGGLLMRVNPEDGSAETILKDLAENAAQGHAYCPLGNDRGILTTDKGLFLIDETGNSTSSVPTPFDTPKACQYGDIIPLGDYLFAAARGKGVAVLDRSEGKAVKTIDLPTVTTVFAGSDGNAYAALDNDSNEFVMIDPVTFGVRDIDTRGQKPASAAFSWDSWRTGMTASAKDGLFYYVNGEGGINCLATASSELQENVIVPPDGLTLYGGICLSPDSRLLYVSATKNLKGSLILAYSTEGHNLVASYAFDASTYWFPAMMAWHDIEGPSFNVADTLTLAIDPSLSPYSVTLDLEASDPDSPEWEMTGFVNAEDEGIVEIDRLSALSFTIKAKSAGRTWLHACVDSQGRQADSRIAVEVMAPGGIDTPICSDDRSRWFSIDGLEVTQAARQGTLRPGLYVKKTPDNKSETFLINPSR